MQSFFKKCSVSVFAISIPLLIVLGIFNYYLPDSFILEEGSSLCTVGDYPIHVQARAPSVTKAEKSFTQSSGGTKGHLMLGIIPIKQIDLKIVAEKEVTVSGMPFGIKLFTKGVLVVGTGEVEAWDSVVNPGDNAGILLGDIIVSIDGKAVNSNEETAKVIEQCGGRPLAIHCIRNGVAMDFVLQPVKSTLDDRYKAGLWVRDSTAGIGTMTFIDPVTGIYGGLGHGVCDVDTGKLMPMSNGEIVPVKICGITKGLSGSAGELLGFFSDSKRIGSLDDNTISGVYGHLEAPNTLGKRVKLAYKQEIVKGKAQILSTISGEEARFYDVSIVHVNYDKENPSKNMVIRITDPELLKLTGGIVQGMSGSPILQNGKLVGAVTHVFVNDPTSGYGIFAENMLAQIDKTVKHNRKKTA